MIKVLLIGRLTADAELKYTQGGTMYASFRVAASEGYKDRTSFLNCQLFGNRAEKLSPYLTKGKQVSLIGTLRIDTYNDNDGNKRISVVVAVDDLEFLGSGKKQETQEPQQAQDEKDIPF